METVSSSQVSTPEVAPPNTSHKLRIMYLRDVPFVEVFERRVNQLVLRRGKPVACIAYTMEGNQFKYGLATHNTVEVYNRKYGRDLAVERYTTSPKQLTNLSQNSTVREALVQLFLELSTNSDTTLPTKVRKSARRYYKAYKTFLEQDPKLAS